VETKQKRLYSINSLISSLGGESQAMKKGVKVWGLIVVLVVIGSVFVGVMPASTSKVMLSE
jgi:hypothetical protein